MYFTAQDVVDNKLEDHVTMAVAAALAVANTFPDGGLLDFGPGSGDGSPARQVYNTIAGWPRSYINRTNLHIGNQPTARAMEWLRQNASGASLTLEQAEQGIALIKEGVITSNGYTFSKWYRPWESFRNRDELPTRLKLNPEKTWVGVEIEIGARSREAMHNIRRYLLDNFDFVTADREGGNYPVEATFPPCEIDKLLAEGSYLNQYYANVLTTDQVNAHSNTASVGTHFNISTPHTRRNSASTLQLNTGNLIDTIMMDDNERDASDRLTRKLFGRWPYGRAYNHDHFVEYKLFNSTRNPEHFAWYVRVMKALIKGADTARWTSGESANRLRALKRLASKSPL